MWLVSRLLADQKFMTIFYAHGLGYYGSVDRLGQFGVVVSVSGSCN